MCKLKRHTAQTGQSTSLAIVFIRPVCLLFAGSQFFSTHRRKRERALDRRNAVSTVVECSHDPGSFCGVSLVKKYNVVTSTNQKKTQIEETINIRRTNFFRTSFCFDDVIPTRTRRDGIWLPLKWSQLLDVSSDRFRSNGHLDVTKPSNSFVLDSISFSVFFFYFEKKKQIKEIWRHRIRSIQQERIKLSEIFLL